MLLLDGNFFKAKRRLMGMLPAKARPLGVGICTSSASSVNNYIAWALSKKLGLSKAPHTCAASTSSRRHLLCLARRGPRSHCDAAVYQRECAYSIAALST
jgi:hypothetical protein